MLVLQRVAVHFIQDLSLKQKLLYLVPIVLAILSIIVGSFMINKVKDMTPEQEGAQFVFYKAKQNVQKLPFKRIVQINRKGQCPPNFKLLKLGEFAGTQRGCICDENGQKSVHYSAYCMLHVKKCEWLMERNPVAIDYVQLDDGTEISFCGQRIQNLKITNEINPCNANPLGNNLCTDDKETPLSEMYPVDQKKKHFNEEIEDDEDTQNSDKNNINIHGKQYELVSDNESLPFIDFALVSNKDCYRIDQQGMTESSHYYLLNKVSQKGCDKTFGEITDGEFIAKVNLLQTYKNALKEEFDKLEYFNESYGPNDTLNLILRRRYFIGKDKNCSDIDIKDMKYIHEDSNLLKILYNVFAWLIIITAVLLILMTIYVKFTQKCKSDLSLKLVNYLFVILVTLIIVIGSIHLLYKYRSNNGLKELSNKYQRYHKNQCFSQNSEPLNQAALNLSEYAKDTYSKMDKQVFILLIAAIIAIILQIIILFLA